MAGFSDNYFLDNLDAFYASDKARDKQRKLDQRTAEKEAKLGLTNALTGEELQRSLSDAVDSQLFLQNGQYTTTKWVPGLDSQGELTMSGVEVPADPGVNVYGSADVRNLYIDDTEQGNYKLGLAATDVNPEFISPWTGKPITPYEARYLDKQGVKGVYLGGGRQYDGTPGPMGVTPEDGALLDITLPGQMATDLEYTVHSNLGQMANRAIGQGAVTQEDILNYGSGKTEYTTPDAPMWNVNTTIPGTLQGNTPLPGNPYDKYAPRVNFDGTATQSIGSADSQNTQDEGFLAEALSLPGAAAHGAVKGIGNLLDFGGELVQRGTNAIFGSDFKGGTFEDGTVDDFANSLGMALGYDHRDDAEVNQKAQVFYDNAFKDVDVLDPSSWTNIGVMDVLRGMGTQLTNPSSAASSLGEIFGTGGAGKGVQIVGKAGIKALRGKAAREAAESAEDVFKQIAVTKADKTLSKADKAKKLGDLKSQVSAIQVASHKMQDAIPAIAYSMDITNQHMAEYRENNNGEEMSNGRMMGTLLANTLAFALPEMATTKIALGMNKTVNAKLKEKLNGGIKEAVGKLVLGGVVEFPQELTEGIVESINTKWGTKAYEGKTMAEIVSEETANILGQAFGGAVGGAHMASPRAAGGLIKDTVGNSKYREALDEKINKLKPNTEDLEDSAQEASAPTPEFGQYTQAAMDKPLDEVKSMLDTTLAELNAQAEAEGKGRTAKDLYKELPTDVQEDMREAQRIYKLKVTEEFEKTGKSDRLGATPDEEFAIISTYSKLDDERAAKFKENIINAKKGEKLNEGDITIEQVMEKAEKARASYTELTGMDQTRAGVVKDGLTADKQGFLSYYREALASEEGSPQRAASVEKLVEFTSLQNQKRDNLAAGNDKAVSEVSDHVNKLVTSQKATAAGITEDTMIKAIAASNGMSQSTAFKQALAEVKAAGLSDKELSLAGKKTVFDYASSNFNRMNEGFGSRIEGTFEANYNSSLRDLMEDKGFNTNELSGKWAESGSNARELISNIDREIGAMTKAVNLIEGKSNKTSPASNTEATGPKPTKETQTPVEEIKEPVEAPISDAEEQLAKATDIALKIRDKNPLDEEDTKFYKANPELVNNEVFKAKETLGFDEDAVEEQYFEEPVYTPKDGYVEDTTKPTAINKVPKTTKAPEDYKKGDDIKLFSQVSITEGPLAGKHITLEFSPEGPNSPAGPAHIADVNEAVDLKITGEYKDDKMHYYTVAIIDKDGNTVTSTQADGVKPLHITVSTAEGVKPVETGNHALNNPDAITKATASKVIKGTATFGMGKYNPDFGKKPATKPTGYPEGMSELDKEVNDLTLMGKMAGISFEVDTTDVNSLLALQSKLIDAAAKSSIEGFDPYVEPEGFVESSDRKARAEKSMNKNSPDNALQHYLAQAAEEVSEVIEASGLPINDKLLEAQKRVFKVIRFSPDRVNKDSGISNKDQMVQQLIEAGRSIDPAKYVTTEDFLKLANRLSILLTKANTSPNAQKPTEKPPIVEKGTSTKEEVKKAPRVKAESDSVNKYLKINPKALSFNDLLNEAGNIIATSKESDEVKQAVKDKQKEIIDELNIKANKGRLDPKKREQVQRIIDKLIAEREQLSAEFESIENDIGSVSEFLTSTGEILDELAPMYKERDELYNDSIWKDIITRVDKGYKELKSLINEYNSANNIRNKDGKINAGVNMGTTVEGYKAIREATWTVLEGGQSFKNTIKALWQLRNKIFRALLDIVNDLIKVKSAYNKAMNDKDAFVKGQTLLNNQINALEAYAEMLHGSNWRSDRAEVFTNFRKSKRNRDRLTAVKNREHGSAVILKALQSKQGYESVYNAPLENATYIKDMKEYNDAKDKSGLTRPDRKNSKYKTTKKSKSSLLGMFNVGNPNSYLASYNVTDEDMQALFNQGEFDFLESNANLATLDKNGKPTAPSKEHFARYPYLMLLRNEDGTMNKNIAAVMKIATDRYLADNADALTQLTPKDLASMYGIKEEDVMAVLSKEEIEGGIPQVFMADRIGKDIMSMLGLKPVITKDADGNAIEDTTEFFEKVQASIGMASILQLTKTGMLEERKHTLNGAPVYTYKLRAGERKALPAFKTSQSIRVKAMEERFGVEPSDKRMIRREPRNRSIEDVTKRNEPLTVVENTIAKAVVKAENAEWQPNADVVNMLLEMPRESLEKLLGKKDETDKTLTKEEEISVIGKNRQIAKDIENLEMLRDEMKAGLEGVYFKWFVAQNSRIFMDADGGLNPQGIKLHRYALSTADMRGRVDDKKDPMSSTIFKLGFAQGLGFGVDKNDVELSKGFADALLTDKALNAIEKQLEAGVGEFTIKVAGKEYAIEIEEPSHAILAIVEGRKYIKANGLPFNTTMVMEVDGLTNGFAHKMLQFLATNAADHDDISESTMDWMKKVGVSFNTKEEAMDMVTRIRKAKEDGKDPDGVIDAYLTLADSLAPIKEEAFTGEALIEQVRARLKAIDDEINSTKDDEYKDSLIEKRDKDRLKRFNTTNVDEIIKIVEDSHAMLDSLRDPDTKKLTKTARNLLKPPFMTFGYGAGFESMSNNITAETIDGIMHGIKNDPTSDKSIKLLNAFGATTDEQKKYVIDALSKTPYVGINIGGRNLVEITRGLMLGIYGDAVADTMNAEFGGIKKMNAEILSGTSVIFNVFNAAYKAEVAKRGLEGAPNKQVHNEIIAVLREKKLLPIVRGPRSTGYDDGIAVYSTTNDPASENEYGDPRVHTGYNKDGKQTSRKVNYTRKVLDGPGAAGLVALTNAEDSLNMALIMNEQDALSVFDALVLGVNQASLVQQFNDDFVEMNMDPNWTQLGTVNEAATRMLDTLNKEYPNEVTAAYKGYAKDRGYEDKKGEENLDTIVEKISKLTGHMNTRREAATLLNMTVEQGVLDKNHASEYNGEKVLNDKIKDTLLADNPEVDVDKMMTNLSHLDKLFDC